MTGVSTVTGIACCAILAASTMLSVWWHSGPSSQGDQESDRALDRYVHSLHAAQMVKERKKQTAQEREMDFLTRAYPRIFRRNFLPNFWTGGVKVNMEDYRTGTLVFVSHHRTAEGVLLRCLEELARNHSLSMSQSMDSDSRYDWHTDQNLDTAHREKMNWHRGQYSFGICDGLDKMCSSVMVFRDPLERAVSSYQYCQTALTDEMCGVSNAREMSLRDWVIHHGSLAFQQLTFDPLNCENIRNSSEYRDKPCWHEHKLWLDTMDYTRRKLILDHVILNMEKWFSVVGIMEDLDTTATFLEHAYGLPFTKCDGLRQYNPDVSVMTNSANRKRRKSDEEYDGYLNDPVYLKEDYAVKNALEADFAIYKKVQQIFRRQKQRIFNSVR